MMQRIREMSEREGMKRGKPIMVAIRVPDSVEYCKEIGIDLETWMEKGEVVEVSNFGRWFLFLSGFLIGGIEAVIVLVIATRFTRQFVTRVGGLGAVLVGAALGASWVFRFASLCRSCSSLFRFRTCGNS